MDTVKIKDICDVFDGPHATPTKTSDGPIYLGIDAITEDGKLNKSQFAHLSEDDYRIWTRRVTPQSGDIVFSYEATLGRYAIIPDGFYGCLGRRLAVIRNKSTRINTKWLYYYFRSPQWSAFINSNIVKGSTVNRISVEDFPEYSVPLLPKNVQDRIASILGNIDRKIEINSHINDNLWQAINTIYDYWFTQFDFPNAYGKPYRTSGGELVWNDKIKRALPFGWTVTSIISNPLTQVIKPGVDVFETKEYLATAEVTGTSIASGSIVDYENREGRANMQPVVNSVWFAKMKNSIKHLFLNKEMAPIIDSTILSTGFCGLQCSEKSFEYVASFVSNPRFEIIKDILAHGATQEAVNNDDMESIAFVIPSDEILEQYHTATKGMFAQISKNICENRELIKVRDWLLPMLMNGQATIAD